MRRYNGLVGRRGGGGCGVCSLWSFFRLWKASPPSPRSKERLQRLLFLIYGGSEPTSVALKKTSSPRVTDVALRPPHSTLTPVPLTSSPFRTNKCIGVEWGGLISSSLRSPLMSSRQRQERVRGGGGKLRALPERAFRISSSTSENKHMEAATQLTPRRSGGNNRDGKNTCKGLKSWWGQEGV